jgi:DNA-binding MarR family transcriptional regulator
MAQQGWDNLTAKTVQSNFTDKLYICYCCVMVRTPSNKDAALASRLAAELRTTFGQIKRKVRQHGGQNDFTSSQIAVLLRLENGPATVSSLARAEGMRPQSMSTVIAPLEDMGFVAGAADPNDGRKTLMSLTKACKKSIEAGRAARQDWLAQAIQQKLSPQEQKQVSSAIHLLARLTED